MVWKQALLGLVTVTATAFVGCGADRTSPTAPAPPEPPAPTSEGCGRTSVGFPPLIDAGSRLYEGHPGGLYPGGSNGMPASHLAAGLELARAVGPRDSEGQPASAGRYAFISIGMSNTTQEFSTFKMQADVDPARDSPLVLVDGAQGGMTAADWSSPGCPCWSTLDARLRQANVSALQVATAWIKLADRQPSEGFPAHAQRLRSETQLVLRQIAERFPNLRLAYLSSRIYAGYATSTLNPEPYAYESGLAVRWVIEDQLSGSARLDGSPPAVPWIAWGPYLWADGLSSRTDGLTWACSDFAADGTHPSASGRQKVAALLMDFVRTDPTAREWYLGQP